LVRFQENVADAAKNSAVEVIFLGDTFDLLRSKRWLVDEWTWQHGSRPTDVRPWSAKNQPPMDYVLTAILEDIRNYYGWFFKELQLPRVKLTWVVGNHDRLAWCTKIGKEFLAQLGIERDPNAEVKRPEYGALARHGHCYDEFNFYINDYAASSFGDVIVVEILNRLQVLVAQERQIVNLDDEEVAFLAELEYVRPYSRIPITVRQAIDRQRNNIIADAIKEGWEKTVHDFLSSKPYRAFVKSNWLSLFLKMLEKSIRDSDYVAKLSGYLEEWKAGSTDWESYARNEPAILKQRSKFVIYGHTHEVVADEQIGNQQFYYNSGWWKRSFKAKKGGRKPFIQEFHVVSLDKGRQPEVKPFRVDAEALWKPADKGYDSTALFSEIQMSRLPSKREGLIRMGIADKVRADLAVENVWPQKQGSYRVPKQTPGYRISWGPNQPDKDKEQAKPKVHGFEVVIERQLGPVGGTTTSGVLIKDTIKGEDIDKAAQLVTTTSGVTNALFFTPGKVGASTKKKAALKNVVLLDATDIEKFKEPKAFGTALDFALSKLKI
jgi:UDP-2,3-diacylglucosamine pyrophosphatase LpxH